MASNQLENIDFGKFLDFGRKHADKGIAFLGASGSFLMVGLISSCFNNLLISTLGLFAAIKVSMITYKKLTNLDEETLDELCKVRTAEYKMPLPDVWYVLLNELRGPHWQYDGTMHGWDITRNEQETGVIEAKCSFQVLGVAAGGTLTSFSSTMVPATVALRIEVKPTESGTTSVCTQFIVAKPALNATAGHVAKMIIRKARQNFDSGLFAHMTMVMSP